MVEEFLNKYEGYITELTNYINTTEKSKEKLNISFQETPAKFIMKRNNEIIYDLNKPKYKLIDYLIQSNKSKILNERKTLRAMVLDYVTDDESNVKIETITDKINIIKERESKLKKLFIREKAHIFHNLVSNYETLESQVENNTKEQKMEKKIMQKKSKLKSEMKKKLKDENTEELNEDDLKLFLFTTLKECAAHPSKKNKAISKKELIDIMVKNPKLKAKLPSSYQAKSKEELCKILFPN
tara:strand:- start:12690 stop:13412 length:723 start_codon:yes stop_codon:yes gene_type:complete